MSSCSSEGGFPGPARSRSETASCRRDRRRARTLNEACANLVNNFLASPPVQRRGPRAWRGRLARGLRPGGGARRAGRGWGPRPGAAARRPARDCGPRRVGVVCGSSELCAIVDEGALMPRYAGNVEAVRSLVHETEVHRDVYLDAEIFRLEMEHVFANAWVYVGHD